MVVGPLPARSSTILAGGNQRSLADDHPVMNAFPHDGFVDMQFYGLATDWVFATDSLVDVLPEITNVRSLLRRLDARQFTVSDYLFEASVGRGQVDCLNLAFPGRSRRSTSGLASESGGAMAALHAAEMALIRGRGNTLMPFEYDFVRWLACIRDRAGYIPADEVSKATCLRSGKWLHEFTRRTRIPPRHRLMGSWDITSTGFTIRPPAAFLTER